MEIPSVYSVVKFAENGKPIEDFYSNGYTENTRIIGVHEEEETTMTTEQIIALAREKLGKDITEQEAQEYLEGKAAIPDEALDLVSGGDCGTQSTCPVCQQPLKFGGIYSSPYCNNPNCSSYH